VLTSGAEVETATKNMRVAYEDELNKSVDKLDGAVSRQLNDLKIAVEQLQSGVDASIRSAAQQAQQIVLSLPFSNHGAATDEALVRS
jgi:predicted transport protein